MLTHGRGSLHAEAFDIDWDFGGGRLRMPVRRRRRPTCSELEVAGDASCATTTTGSRSRPAPATATTPSVHDRQHYELVNWRRADAELNYRRFFAVNTLAGVRVEDPEVFDACHVEIRRWFDEGLVDGLRIDHPDGLRDPGGYLDDLAEPTGGAYVLVEKILEPGEELPPSWATAGTTGYDALGLLDRVLVDPAGEEPLDALEPSCAARPSTGTAMIHDTKRAVADGILAPRCAGSSASSAVPRLDGDGRRAAASSTRSPSCSPASPCTAPTCPRAASTSTHASRAARGTGPTSPPTLDALGRCSRPAAPGGAALPADLRHGDGQGRRGLRVLPVHPAHLAQRGRRRPDVFAMSRRRLPRRDGVRQADWPDAMTTLTTHDTKRGEDVRARITVLAEVAGALGEALDRAARARPAP